MIITRLMGGLGNQMFQYAAGRALSLRLNMPLLLDHSFLEARPDDARYTFRNYELDVFGITARRATEEQVGQRRKYLSGPIHSRLYKYFHGFMPVEIFREKSFRYDERFERISKPAYLEGYFQSPRYFELYRNVLNKDFTFTKPPTATTSMMMDKIASCDSVSIHVRRGDMVTLPEAASFHGTCDLAYYRKAVSLILSHVPSAKFFLFSDDPEWIEENFDPGVPFTNVSGNPNHDDLRLMSACRHNIIANSSFSWWAAWLNANPNKTIIGPLKWFNDASIDTSDLFPKDWLRL